MYNLGSGTYRKMPARDLPPDHYRIRVNRGPLPPQSVLKERFFTGGVSDLYNGQYEWKKHSSRLGVNDVTAEEVVMVVKRFSEDEIWEMGGLESENIIAWGLARGLIPADEKETYAFGVNPETHDLQREFSMIGLGSFSLHGGRLCVAALRCNEGGRVFDRRWFCGRWGSFDLFLFVVRKRA